MEKRILSSNMNNRLAADRWQVGSQCVSGSGSGRSQTDILNYKHCLQILLTE